MAIHSVWANESKTIMAVVFEGQWTWDEYFASVDERTVMMDSVNHQVDFIVDFRDSAPLPKMALKNLAKAAQQTHPNQGMTVIVGATKKTIARALEIFSRTFYDLSFVNNNEEAFKLIEGARQVSVAA
ncbi:MAG: hypothetical protein GYB68_04425 [Chloroflexi bacterium]|nr:hypothetical protein [Chloroflexota bacterium]